MSGLLKTRGCEFMQRDNKRNLIFAIVAIVPIAVAVANGQAAGSFAKAQVSDRIRKVEDGVDEFRKYLENRGDNARDNAQAAQNSGNTRRGRSTSSSTAGSRQQRAGQTKDELDDALGELNTS